MKKYELVPHTADIGIRAYGKGIKQLFVNAATGMFEQIADLRKVREKEEFYVNIKASDYEELLILWLSELLNYNTIEEKLFRSFHIEDIDDKHIVSTAKGEGIDLDRHTLNKEVKAVTFHDVKIEKKDGIYTTQIIFDV